MQEEDLQALRTAVATLEHPGLAARLAQIAGKPIELIGRALPETASKAVATATIKALDAALSVALRTMKNEPKRLKSASQSLSRNVGCSWRQFWACRPADRASDLDYYHVAVHWRCCPKRG